jgi:hypothetical protein
VKDWYILWSDYVDLCVSGGNPTVNHGIDIYRVNRWIITRLYTMRPFEPLRRITFIIGLGINQLGSVVVLHET